MELNFKTFGQGEPIIILHGLFGMLDNWQTIAKKLAEDYMVFIVDQRNHGRSPHVGEHTYAAMAEDLHAFMIDQYILRAHVIGHSMGGKTAMEFAGAYPEMLDKLVVVDIAPKQYPEGGHTDVFDALLNLDFAKADSRKDINEQLSRYVKEQGVKQFLMKNVDRSRDNGFQFKMNLPIIHRDYLHILEAPYMESNYEGETLFIRGANSKYIQDQDWPSTQEQFTNATLATVEDAGHWVHAEQPQQLLDLVRDFLKV